MPTVFVVQESPGKDIIAAASFGNIEVLMPPNRQIMFSPVPAVRHIRDKLRNFSDEDFILAIGDPVAIGVACAIAADINAGRVKILKWDRLNTRYYPVTIDIHPERRAREDGNV
jgi:hypothetical protein